MDRLRAAKPCPLGGFGRLLLALTTLLPMASAARAQTPPAAGAKPPLSPAQTIAYIADRYKGGASAPNLAFHIRYSPPFLTATWQAEPAAAGPAPGVTVVNHAQIDLRYAHFAVWNTGGADNTIIVDCTEAYFCYRQPNEHRQASHGDLDYKLTTYAARHIARALNYLASLNAENRPQDPFSLSAVVAAGSQPSGTVPGQ